MIFHASSTSVTNQSYTGTGNTTTFSENSNTVCKTETKYFPSSSMPFAATSDSFLAERGKFSMSDEILANPILLEGRGFLKTNNFQSPSYNVSVT